MWSSLAWSSAVPALTWRLMNASTALRSGGSKIAVAMAATITQIRVATMSQGMPPDPPAGHTQRAKNDASIIQPQDAGVRASMDV